LHSAINAGHVNAHSLAIRYANRGNAYQYKGDHDRAVDDYDEATRLGPKLASPYIGRCRAHRSKGKSALALADCNEAVRLDPKSARAYDNRAMAYFDKGDYARAIADYNEEIQVDPKNSRSFLHRAMANLYGGSPAKAMTDLTQSVALDGKYAYAALWLDVLDKRINLPSQLAETTKQIDMTKWPAAIIRLYLGQLTPEATLAAADDADPHTKESQVCEANFFSGELALLRGAKDEATLLFRQASAGCPKVLLEYSSAVAELKALGATP
jgi:lipoprotein NlpI